MNEESVRKIKMSLLPYILAADAVNRNGFDFIEVYIKL